MSNRETHLSDLSYDRIASGVPTMEDCRRCINKKPNMPHGMLERFSKGVPTMADCQSFLYDLKAETPYLDRLQNDHEKSRRSSPAPYVRGSLNSDCLMHPDDPGAELWNSIFRKD